jgi:hypothetical protein
VSGGERGDAREGQSQDGARCNDPSDVTTHGCLFPGFFGTR